MAANIALRAGVRIFSVETIHKKANDLPTTCANPCLEALSSACGARILGAYCLMGGAMKRCTLLWFTWALVVLASCSDAGPTKDVGQGPLIDTGEEASGFVGVPVDLPNISCHTQLNWVRQAEWVLNNYIAIIAAENDDEPESDENAVHHLYLASADRSELYQLSGEAGIVPSFGMQISSDRRRLMFWNRDETAIRVASLYAEPGNESVLLQPEELGGPSRNAFARFDTDGDTVLFDFFAFDPGDEEFVANDSDAWPIGVSTQLGILYLVNGADDPRRVENKANGTYRYRFSEGVFEKQNDALYISANHAVARREQGFSPDASKYLFKQEAEGSEVTLSLAHTSSGSIEEVESENLSIFGSMEPLNRPWDESGRFYPVWRYMHDAESEQRWEMFPEREGAPSWTPGWLSPVQSLLVYYDQSVTPPPLSPGYPGIPYTVRDYYIYDVLNRSSERMPRLGNWKDEALKRSEVQSHEDGAFLSYLSVDPPLPGEVMPTTVSHYLWSSVENKHYLIEKLPYTWGIERKVVMSPDASKLAVHDRTLSAFDLETGGPGTGISIIEVEDLRSDSLPQLTTVYEVEGEVVSASHYDAVWSEDSTSLFFYVIERQQGEEDSLGELSQYIAFADGSTLRKVSTVGSLSPAARVLCQRRSASHSSSAQMVPLPSHAARGGDGSGVPLLLAVAPSPSVLALRPSSTVTPSRKTGMYPLPRFRKTRARRSRAPTPTGELLACCFPDSSRRRWARRELHLECQKRRRERRPMSEAPGRGKKEVL